MRFTYYAVAAVVSIVAQPAVASSSMGIEHIDSERSFEQVTDQLNSALEEKGLMLVASIDHAQNAANNELSLPATTTFIFGNPNVGTPMMQCNGSVALDLPQKMVVRETDNGVRIEWNDPQYLAERHQLKECDLPLDNVANILRDVAESAAH
ncbi:DUF302 domain-containing protein [Vreelandella andesensis]|uniref:DUF302 domain-containing protein n=1 Tax=Vreelandella andesensis TaxID=447567 RepID=A0A3S0YC94_9GAMM|nr:DUF302 domain-containing protein [Halomonas andesensis]RUR26701.1 DUF302 domain-containing protein [Halomonas andesensis]